MATPRRRIHAPGTYFITSRTWESREIFLKPAACELFIETLLKYRAQGEYFLHGFVLMPDHLHALVTPGSNTSLERAAQLIKGGSSRIIAQALGFRFPVWQAGFSDHRIRDAHDYESHVRYMEENPIKRRLAASLAEYRWSSASGRYATDGPPQGLKPLSGASLSGAVETAP